MKKEITITIDTPLNQILELGKVCNRKNNCCRYGSGFLIEGDLKKIAKKIGKKDEKVKEEFLDEKEYFNRKMLRPKLKGAPYGECVFFDGNGCSIHDVKPLQCRLGNCSSYGEEISAWFLLNHIIDKDDPESIRQYALYIKSGGKVIQGGKLEELMPDKDKLKKILEYKILR